MASSNTIVVNTVVQDRAVPVDSFGTLMALVYTTAITEPLLVDVSADGLVALTDAGFATSSDAYRKVAAANSQDVHPSTMLIYPRAAANAQEYTITPVLTTEGKTVYFEVDVGGTVTEITYTIGAAETPTTIATALQALLNAISGLTAVDDGGSVTISPDDDEERIYLRNLPGTSVLTIDDGSADAGIADDFAAALADTSIDWYGVTCDSTSGAELTALAAATAAAGKLMVAMSLDSDNCTAGSGVAAAVAATSNPRASIFVTKDSIGQGAVGITSRQFSQAPGSSTWAHKPIVGAVADAWSSGELAGLRANNALIYFSEPGLDHTLDGKAASGRFLDVTRGIDWLNSRIHSDMLTRMASVEKIPYTDPGAAVFEGTLQQSLAAAVAAGLLAPGSVQTFRGKVADQSAANKASRVFPALSWKAQLAGAIHSVNPVAGTVTL